MSPRNGQEFQSASLMLCWFKISTVDPLGQIAARPLVRVRVGVRVRVLGFGPCPRALIINFSQHL